MTTPDDIAADYRKRVDHVRDHMARNLDAPVDLASLARLAHFSPFHFHRVFRGVTGLPVLAYVRGLRLERAAAELERSDRSILLIALACGYESHEAFTRAFKDHFTVTPTEYRRGQRPPRPPVLMHPPSGELLMDVRIVTVDPIRVVSIRHIGAYGSPGIADTWSRLCAWAGPKGILGPGTRCFGIGHDEPESTPPEKTRYDACLTAPAHIQGEGEVVVQTIAGGRYATTRHIGPYQKLAETYGALFGRWLPANGHEPAETPPFEEYVNFPNNTPPEQLITDIYIALKPAATAAAR